MFRRFLLFLDLIPLSSKHTLPQTPDATNLAKVHIKGQHAGNQNSFHTNTNTQVHKYKHTNTGCDICKRSRCWKPGFFGTKHETHKEHMQHSWSNFSIKVRLAAICSLKFHSKDLGVLAITIVSAQNMNKLCTSVGLEGGVSQCHKSVSLVNNDFPYVSICIYIYKTGVQTWYMWCTVLHHMSTRDGS